MAKEYTGNASSWFYRFCRSVCFWTYKLGWRLEVRGHENVPELGGVIIAANHRSYADPPLIGVSLKRPVHFLAKKELFSFKPFGLMISHLNAHPLDRTSGISALRAATRLLKMGDGVIVFPEGRRSKTDNLEPGKPGVGMLALSTKCPVIPAYIHNSGHLNKLKKLTVCFGKPVNPKAGDDYQNLTDQVMNEISKLRDEIQAEY